MLSLEEKERIMHNYGQLSRGRGGGNKWSCRELATRQESTLGKKEQAGQGGSGQARRSKLGKEDQARQGGAGWPRRIRQGKEEQAGLGGSGWTRRIRMGKD